MFVRELLARLRDRALCASITCVAALCPGPERRRCRDRAGVLPGSRTALRFRFARWWVVVMVPASLDRDGRHCDGRETSGEGAGWLMSWWLAAVRRAASSRRG
jgi:hypothetical protein